MSAGQGPFRVGQEVTVTIKGQIKKVVGGNTTQILVEGKGDEPHLSWISPYRPHVNVQVTGEPLPTEPGMYRTDKQEPAEGVGIPVRVPYHTDGWEFFYLNTDGDWVDVGWGSPSPSDGRLVPMVTPPF